LKIITAVLSETFGTFRTFWTSFLTAFTYGRKRASELFRKRTRYFFYICGRREGLRDSPNVDAGDVHTLRVRPAS